MLINDHSLITADKFSSGQSWIRNDAYHTCTWILQYSIFKVSVSFLLRGIYICWNCWKFSIYSCLCIYHIRGQNVHNSLDHTKTIVLVYCIQRRDKQIYPGTYSKLNSLIPCIGTLSIQIKETFSNICIRFPPPYET